MSAWTATRRHVSLPLDPRDYAAFDIRDHNGFVAVVVAPDTDEGRATVAKMVAALQMEEALEGADAALGRVSGEPHSVAIAEEWIGVRAALEAAKRLP